MDSLSNIEIKQLILNELNELEPYITSHGGKIEFVEYKKSVVYVRLHGTCVQCPLSFYTLTYGLERQLKSKLSFINRVEAIESE